MSSSLSPKSHTFVNTEKQLKNCIIQLLLVDTLCLDTEFHSENRYLPKLMLLQLSDLNQNTWIIDTLAVDITPLASIIQDKTIILHGGYEDLRILFYRLAICPNRVFDTQIAAAFLGVHYPTRLDMLISTFLNINEEQSQTLSDWAKRPLSSEQLKYAAEDVSALVPLFLALKEQLKDRMSLVWEVCLEFARDISQPPQKSPAWLLWGVSKTLSTQGRNILTELLEWRETIAEQKNKPPNYILPKNIAVDISRRCPQTIQTLKQNRRIHNALVKNHGQALLKCVQKGSLKKTSPAPITTHQLQLVHLIRSFALAAGQQHGIDPMLLIPQNIALEIAYRGVSTLKGWRQRMLSSDLDRFLSGQLAVSLHEEQVVFLEL